MEQKKQNISEDKSRSPEIEKKRFKKLDQGTIHKDKNQVLIKEHSPLPELGDLSTYTQLDFGIAIN